MRAIRRAVYFFHPRLLYCILLFVDNEWEARCGTAWMVEARQFGRLLDERVD